MKALVLALCLFLPLCVSSQKSRTPQGRSCPRPIDARLRDYFEAAAIAPAALVNNDPGPGLRTKTTIIPLPDHKIEWINTWNNDELLTSITIDGDLIPFKGLQTINVVDGLGKGKLDLIEDWRQARLYRVFDHDTIGIEMGANMCTGLMCSVGFQLIYDVKTRTASFFGTFRTESEINLYHLGNEDRIFYLSKTFIGAPNSSNSVVTEYDPYELTDDGHIREFRDKAGSKYWLKHQYHEFEFGKAQRLDQHWFEKID